MSEQLPMLPYICGFKGCEKDAVCGLTPRSDPSVVFNVCDKHFRRMKGYPFTEVDAERKEAK